MNARKAGAAVVMVAFAMASPIWAWNAMISAQAIVLSSITPNNTRFTTPSQEISFRFCGQIDLGEGYFIAPNTDPTVFSVQATSGCQAWQPYAYRIYKTLTLSPGQNFIYFQTTDQDGQNVSSGGTYYYDPVSVTPQAPQSVVVGNAGTATFTVRNNTTTSRTLTFSPTCAVATCGATTPTSAVLAANASTTVSVAFTTATVGSGTVTLSASSSGASGSGIASVSVIAPPAPIVTLITPTGTHFAATQQTFSVRACLSIPGGMAETAISWNGYASNTNLVYNVGPTTGCASGWYGYIINVTVTLNPGANTLALSAFDQNYSGGAVNATYYYDPPPPPTIAAPAASTIGQGTQKALAFTLTSTAPPSTGATYGIVATCALVTCSQLYPSSIYLVGGATQQVTLIATGNTVGNGTVTIAATPVGGTGTSATTSVIVKAPWKRWKIVPGPVVTTGPGFPAVVHFSVVDTGGAGTLVTARMRARCATAIAPTPPGYCNFYDGSGPTSEVNGAGPIDVRAVGSNTPNTTEKVWLFYDIANFDANGNISSWTLGDSAYMTLNTIPRFAVAVSPHDSTVTKRQPNAEQSETFRVTNTGFGAEGGISLTATCGSFTDCTVAPGMLQLTSQASELVTVTYRTAGILVTSNVKLVATTLSAQYGIVGRDSGTKHVTVNETIAPIVTVVPRQDSLVRSRAFTAVITICDPDGVVSLPVATFNGRALPPTFGPVLTDGCVSTQKATYALIAAPGTNTFNVTATDSYHPVNVTRTFTFDPEWDAKPIVRADLPYVRVPALAVRADTFRVKNPSLYPVEYIFTADCSALGGSSSSCEADIDVETIWPGQTRKTVVTYTAPTSGTNRAVKLTVGVNPSYSYPEGNAGTVAVSSDSILVSIGGGGMPRVALLPTDGTTTTSATPLLQVDWCDPDDALTVRELRVNGTLLTHTPVTQSVAGCVSASRSSWNVGGLNPALLVPGPNTIAARVGDAAGHLASATAVVTFTPPMTAFAPQVTPKNTTTFIKRNNATSTKFIVRNAGSFAARYTYTVSCGTFANCAQSLYENTLQPNSADTVQVWFNGPPNLNTLTTVSLIAATTSSWGPSIADTARLTIGTPTLAMAFQPQINTPTPGSYGVPGEQSIIGVYVRNLGIETATYTMSVSATTAGVVPSGTAPMTVPAGQELGFWMTPIARCHECTDIITFKAVVRDGADSVFATAGYWFTGRTPPPAYAVAVTPKSTSKTLRLNEVTHENIIIANAGTSPDSYTYLVTCAANLGCAPGAGMTGMSGQVGTLARDSAASPLRLNYHAPGTENATGDIVIRVTSVANASVFTTSTVTVKASTPPPMAVATDSVNSGTVTERSACLSVATGSGAIYECGDLRLVHDLPTLRTMNKARTASLTFVSRHAAPVAYVAANVTGSIGTNPTGITATVRVTRYGSTAIVGTASQNFPWNAGMSDGKPRRIVVPVTADILGQAQTDVHGLTGVYEYRFEVKPATGSVSFPLVETTGSFTLVDRRNSPFGSGWWVEGLETLRPLDATHRLWIGGDGSTRVYRFSNVVASGANAGDSVFIASPTLSRPDSLVRTTTGETARRIPGGARVTFTTAGEHSATITAQGHITSFVHQSSRLQTITAPYRVGNRFSYYAFAYGLDGLGFQRLSTVTAAYLSNGGAAAASRITQVAQTNGWVTGIIEPDNRSVSFRYDVLVTNVTAPVRRVIRRINRLNDSTSFTYDGRGLLATAAVHMKKTPADTASPLVQSFCAAESRSIAKCTPGAPAVDSQPLPLSKVYTLYNGPRGDVSDTTVFFSGRYATVDKIINALGDSTRIERSTAFPLLAEKVTSPTGLVTSTEYNARGLPTHTKTMAPYAVDENAIAHYEWHDIFPKPTKITSPKSVVTRMDYTATGDLWWQEDGRGSATRTTYHYYDGSDGPANLLEAITDPLTNVSRFAYDTVGNFASSTSPRGTVERHFTNAFGRDTLVESSIDVELTLWQKTRTVHDASDRDSLTQAIGPAMNGAPLLTASVTTLYDKEGRPLRVARRSTPDPTGIDTMVTRWEYDAAGRAIRAHASDDKTDATFFDAAGNADSVVTRRGSVIKMTYDALNRVLTRTVPSVTYAMEDTSGVVKGSFFDPLQAPYPRIPNSGTSYLIPTRTDKFTYTPNGQIETATNEDTRVTRVYWPNGQLKEETLEVRNSDAGSLAPWHSYTLQNAYRIDGKRSSLTLPTQLVGSAGNAINYSYADLTGSLETIVDPLGLSYTYGYTTRNEVASLAFPGNYQQKLLYDDEGNVAMDSLVNTGAVGHPRWPIKKLRATTMQYDGRGKRVGSQDAIGFQDTFIAKYDGLGQVMVSDLSQVGHADGVPGSGARYTNAETVSHDALGNIVSAKTSDAMLQYVPDWNDRSRTVRYRTSTHLAKVGRLQSEGHGQALSGNPSLFEDGVKTFRYDLAGNVEFSSLTNLRGDLITSPHEDRFTYYAADGQIRASDYRRMQNGSVPSTAATMVFEEYRYDALGRRVWVRSHRNCANFAYSDLTYAANCLASVVRRTVWDGSQELIEIQAAGDASQTAATLENDDSQVVAPRVNYVDPNPFYGRVLYIHGLEIDRPVASVRYNYVDYFYPKTTATRFPVQSLSLFWNARGQLALWACGVGTRACASNNVEMLVNMPAAWFAYERPKYLELSFHGTLLKDKQDAVGTLYRRNRSYDPQTGRFTQEDPIGLAGGMNLYGFAGGDPVNFSDPFGLCPVEKTGRPCVGPLGDGPQDLRTDGNPRVGQFGMVRNGGTRAHQGNDIHALRGQAIVAADMGTVTASGYSDTYGNYVEIGHPGADGKNVSYTFYAHLQNPAAVKKGGSVKAGQVIGAAGQTGNAGGTPMHLHFELRTKSMPGRGLEGRQDPRPHTSP